MYRDNGVVLPGLFKIAIRLRANRDDERQARLSVENLSVLKLRCSNAQRRKRFPISPIELGWGASCSCSRLSTVSARRNGTPEFAQSAALPTTSLASHKSRQFWHRLVSYLPHRRHSQQSDIKACVTFIDIPNDTYSISPSIIRPKSSVRHDR